MLCSKLECQKGFNVIMFSYKISQFKNLRWRHERGGQQGAMPPRPPGALLWGLEFRIQGLGFRVEALGFRVQDSGFRVQGSGFRVQGSGFRVQGSGF